MESVVPAAAAPPEPVLLYDGLCGFCDGAVAFVLRRGGGGLRFAPLQGEFAEGVFERHPEFRTVDSLLLVEHPGREDEQVRTRSEAALAIASRLGWPWRAGTLLRLVPGSIRDAVYDAFARNRYRWFPRREACRIPEPSVRDRFLD